jgi:ERCC4-type nuclease
MIFVDERGGSCELIEPLKRMGLPITSVPRLPAGDLLFEGRGEKGAPVQIGIEFKGLEELVGNLRTERLQGHQMVEMRQTFDHSYLLYEGEIHYSRRGSLQHRVKKAFGRIEWQDIPGRMTVGELMKRVNVLHLCGGLNPIHTDTRADTLQQLSALYHTWTDTDLDAHKSHLAVYVAPQLALVSDVRRTYCTLPHIGRRASLAVEQAFRNIATAFDSSIADWAAVQITDDKGNKRRLGMKAATDIVNYIRGLR